MLSVDFKEVARSGETVDKGGEERIRELTLGAARKHDVDASIC